MKKIIYIASFLSFLSGAAVMSTIFSTHFNDGVNTLTLVFSILSVTLTIMFLIGVNFDGIPIPFESVEGKGKEKSAVNHDKR